MNRHLTDSGARPAGRQRRWGRAAGLSFSVALAFAGAGSVLVASGTAGAASTSAATPVARTGVHASAGNRPLGIVSPVSAGLKASAVVGNAPARSGGTVSSTKAYPCSPLYLTSGFLQACKKLGYHTGPVMGTKAMPGTNTVYAIFWQPPGYRFSPGYQQIVTKYLQNVAATDGKPTNVYATDTQYYEMVNGHRKYIHYATHFGGSFTVRTAFPTGGCTPSGGYAVPGGACVSDPQIQTELANFIAMHNLPVDDAHMYMVYFPQLVETCIYTATVGHTVCSAGAAPTVAAYCAYHSWFGGTPLHGGTPTAPIYGDMPYPWIVTTGPTCAVPPFQSPNGNIAADTMVSITNHENNEAITDPFFTGWWNPTAGTEIGDECAYRFGTALGGATGAQWNQTINGYHYFTQLEWSNDNYTHTGGNGCIGAEEPPIASFTVNPSPVHAGQKVAFTAKASMDPDSGVGLTYTWNIDGYTPPGNPWYQSYRFAHPGTYPVTLTVTDEGGFSATTTITVHVLPMPGR